MLGYDPREARVSFVGDDGVVEVGRSSRRATFSRNLAPLVTDSTAIFFLLCRPSRSQAPRMANPAWTDSTHLVKLVLMALRLELVGQNADWPIQMQLITKLCDTSHV